MRSPLKVLLICAVFLAAFALTITPIRAAEENDGSTLTKVGDAAPAFEFTTLDGTKITSESAKGKVVLLNFFATWCGPCRNELPHLAEAYTKLKDNDHVIVVSVGREHSKEELVKFKEETNLDLPFAPDPERKMYSKFATRWIPRNYVIGPDGTILMQEIGFSQEEFKKMLDLIDAKVKELEKGSEA